MGSESVGAPVPLEGRAAPSADRAVRRPSGIGAALGRSVRAYGPAGGVLAMLAVLWELLSRVVGVPEYVLPPLDKVFATLVNSWSDTLASATWTTTVEVLLGFGLSVLAALLIAVLLHLSAVVRLAVYPLLISSQAVPIVVVAPILVIIFGYTLTPKLLVVALLCFFPVVVNTLDGLSSVDPQLLLVMKTLYGTRWSVFRRVEFPAALPSAFSGIRVAATYAPIGAVFAEYAGSQNGLGYLMIQAVPSLQTELVFASIFVLTAESIALFLAVSAVERLICPWAKEGKSR